MWKRAHSAENNFFWRMLNVVYCVETLVFTKVIKSFILIKLILQLIAMNKLWIPLIRNYKCIFIQSDITLTFSLNQRRNWQKKGRIMHCISNSVLVWYFIFATWNLKHRISISNAHRVKNQIDNENNVIFIITYCCN